MKKLFNALPNIVQGFLIGVAAVFAAVPFMWLFAKWVAMFSGGAA